MSTKPFLSQLVVPHRTPMYDGDAVMTRPWVQFLERVAANAAAGAEAAGTGPPSTGTPGLVTGMVIWGDQAAGAPQPTAITAVIGGLPSGHFKFSYTTPTVAGGAPDPNFADLHIEIRITDSAGNPTNPATGLPTTWVDTFSIPTTGAVVWEQTDWFPLNTSTPIYCQVRYRSRGSGTPTQWSAYSSVHSVQFPAGNGIQISVGRGLTYGGAGPAPVLMLNSSDTTNMLLNGDFENSMDSIHPDGWIEQAPPTGNGWVMDGQGVGGSMPADSGTKCVRITDPNANLQQYLNVNDVMYVLDLWYAASSAAASSEHLNVVIWWYDATGAATSSPTYMATPNGSTGLVWTHFTQQFQPPATANSCAVGLFGGGTVSANHWWVDNIKMYRAPDATQLQGLGATIDVESNALVVKSASLALAQMLPGGMTNSTFLSSGAINDVTKFANGVLANNAIFGNAVILNANIGTCSLTKLEAGNAVFTGQAVFASGHVIINVNPVGGAAQLVFSAGHGYTTTAGITFYVGGFVGAWETAGLNGAFSSGVSIISTTVIQVPVNIAAAGSGGLPAIGSPALSASTDPNVIIQSSGITMNNSNLIINATSGGNNYNLSIGPTIYDSSYGSLAIAISGTSTLDAAYFVSRGVVAYYGSPLRTRIALVRDPTAGNNGGQLVLYDNTGTESVFLNGTAGEVRSAVYMNVNSGRVVIDNNEIFQGNGGVLCANNGVGGIGFNCIYPVGVPTSYYPGVNWTITFGSSFTVAASASSAGTPTPPGGSFTKLVFKGGLLTGVL